MDGLLGVAAAAGALSATRQSHERPQMARELSLPILVIECQRLGINNYSFQGEIDMHHTIRCGGTIGSRVCREAPTVGTTLTKAVRDPSRISALPQTAEVSRLQCAGHSVCRRQVLTGEKSSGAMARFAVFSRAALDSLGYQRLIAGARS